MQICVVGTGYVGLVAGTCLADLGHAVHCVDKDQAKINLLRTGGVPIYEPGLDQLIKRNVRENRLEFSTDGPGAIAAAEVIFIAVGTPSAEDGSADLSGVFAVAELIGRSMAKPGVVVIKSTVPVGTADKVREIVAAHTDQDFDIVSNPEFLKEGAAIDDFMKPDRIVVGCAQDATQKVMSTIYAPLLRTGKPILFMDNRSAELAKYASNAFLATKISFINELARLCERVGADIEHVRIGAGTDSRIGLRFFFPGVGYGGSCFPKDVRALVHIGAEAENPMTILEAVDRVNERQKEFISEKVVARFGEQLSALRVAVWGLSFKPRTDDMREAPSLRIIEELLRRGAQIVVYDPEAMDEARKILGDRIQYAHSPLSAAQHADALLLITEWNEFRNPSWALLERTMRGRVVFDGRNIWDPDAVRAAGFEYTGIGRP